MFKKFIILVILCIVLVLALRNYIAASLIQHYIKKEFTAECSVGEVKVFISGIEINDLTFKAKDFTGSLKQGSIVADLHNLFKLKSLEIFLGDLFFQINDMESFKQTLQAKYLKTSAKDTDKKALPLHLDLIDARIKIDDPKVLTLDVDLTFEAIFEGSHLKKLKDLEIKEGSLRKGGTVLVFDVKKETSKLSLLRITSLKIKEKEAKNIFIPLAVSDESIVFERVDGDLFGSSAVVSGVFDFKDYNNLCVSLKANEVSFANVISLAGSDKNFSIDGAFSGSFKACLRGVKLEDIEGNFYNNKGGLVNIKKEADLAFLKRHLDEKSYQAIIDNFKNYNYNEGEIGLSKEGSDLALKLNFDSKDSGKRDIMINFHNILGGEE